ncbi:MAG: hypothetical protein LBN27_03580 [Prevotellaceae bacterium]|jgi:hypothetical protein|nr:hypothetical protein [Prevotellaceae bacterium]
MITLTNEQSEQLFEDCNELRCDNSLVAEVEIFITKLRDGYSLEVLSVQGAW